MAQFAQDPKDPLLCVSIGAHYSGKAGWGQKNSPRQPRDGFEVVRRCCLADAPRGVASWFLLWFVSAGMGALFAGFSLKMHAMPERYLNLPRKQAFLSLPPEAKGRVWAVAAFHMLVFTAIFMLVFLTLHVFTALVAFEMVDRLPVAWLLAGIAASIAETLVMTIRLLNTVNSELGRYARTTR